MKRVAFAAIFALVSVFAMGQGTPSPFPYAKLIPNDTATGTTQFTLTKINSSGNAVIMATTDTNGYTGVCVENCGTSGSAWVVFAGLVPLKVDATSTVDHYIQISSTTGGDGKDTGATTFPTSGGSVVGRVQAASTGANSVSMVDLFPAETSSALSSPIAFASQTDGATVTWAIASAPYVNASLTFTTHGGSRTLNITNPVNGGQYVIWLKQDATGGEGLTLGTGCTWKVSGGGAGAITLSSTANAIDILAFTYDGTNCYATLTKNFS